MRTSLRKLTALTGAAAMTVAAVMAGTAATAAPGPSFDAGHLQTATPIKHLVVIFDENISFDHYFGTYPNAANPPGEPPFYPAPFTPKVNNLLSDNLLTENPNLNSENGTAASNPFRLDRTQASTTDQDHSYTPEQEAFDKGAMDLFPLHTGTGGESGSGAFYTAAVVMGYFDGNTVTALWNYAQHFAMSDNHYDTGFGPSTPGAIEVVSGQTNGFQQTLGTTSASTAVADGNGGLTDIGDIDPGYDVCSSKTTTAQMLGKNIGDLLNEHNISWGGFMGGFNLSLTNANGTTLCDRSTLSAVTNEAETDYIPHHEWFQYYPSTANPTHARPSSLWAIGHTYDANGQKDPANHQYDVQDFFAAVQAGNFPAVAYLKPPGYQDGHAGYSDPLDEQAWIVQVVNFIEHRPEWKDTAIIIDWDDSDGWYDHAFVAPTNPSYSTADQLDAPGICGSGVPADGLDGTPVNGRCGPGPREPFFVISPYAKPNYVGHTLINQASVVRFIEDNWLHGERIGGGSFDATTGSIMDLFDFSANHFPNPPLFLSEDDGTPVASPGALAASTASGP